jgi:hypothetical protein
MYKFMRHKMKPVVYDYYLYLELLNQDFDILVLYQGIRLSQCAELYTNNILP